jgi:hypothetical protein
MDKYYDAINDLLTILENNYRYSYGKKISFEEVFEMMEDLYILFQNVEKNTKKTGDIIVKRYIPLLDLLIKVDRNTKHTAKYDEILKYSYKLGARVSLEHYMVYREWDIPENEKFFEPRYNILVGYMHYLQVYLCSLDL